MTRYVITVDFLDDGQIMVQAEGDPYPLGLFKETGADPVALVDGALAVVCAHEVKVSP